MTNTPIGQEMVSRTTPENSTAANSPIGVFRIATAVDNRPPLEVAMLNA